MLQDSSTRSPLTLFAANEALSLKLSIKSKDICIPGLEPDAFRKEEKLNPNTQTGSQRADQIEYARLSAPPSQDFSSFDDPAQGVHYLSSERLDSTFQWRDTDFELESVSNLFGEGPNAAPDVTFQWQAKDFDFDSVWNLPVPSEKELVLQGLLGREKN